MPNLNPAAKGALPIFITAPGQSDILLIVAAIFALCAVFAVGVLYLRLHALPEQIAHRTNKVQMEVVAVLALIALFTNDHVYWIAALLLAFIKFPNFITPVISMARSLRTVAARVIKADKARHAEEKKAKEAASAKPAAPADAVEFEVKELGNA